MGAMLTQHPELCTRSCPSVGIYDMLRVELSPNGAFNVTEFGTVKDAAQFKALYAYSPYHHVDDGAKYPAILFTTGANDPRVEPWQSRKMVARAAGRADRQRADPAAHDRQGRARHGLVDDRADRARRAWRRVHPGAHQMTEPHTRNWTSGRNRLDAIARRADPETQRHLVELGICDGWNCLEIGAGSGSMAKWIAHRVAPGGRVVATDVDTKILDDLKVSNMEVRRHDVDTEELPASTYDLVVARYLFEWLKDPRWVLERIARSLVPGGWVLLESGDWGALPPPTPGSGQQVQKVREAFFSSTVGRPDTTPTSAADSSACSKRRASKPSARPAAACSCAAAAPKCSCTSTRWSSRARRWSRPARSRAWNIA